MKKYTTEINEDYALLDKSTGEILEYKQTKKVSMDEFILVFLHSIPEICKLEGNAIKLLICLWKISSFNPYNTEEGNLFYNNTFFKSQVRYFGLDMSDGSINLYISQLAKTNFIIKKCRGAYLLNPKYFFKGTLSNRSKLQLSIEVDPIKE